MSKTSEFVWFNISGGIGTVLFYFFNEFVVGVLPALLDAQLAAGAWRDEALAHLPAIAWGVSYMCSILWQHALHRYLVFGPDGNYLKSLAWTYVSYSVALVLSVLVNDVLTHRLHVHVRVAWVLTLLATGVINYFALQKAYQPETKAAKQQ